MWLGTEKGGFSALNRILHHAPAPGSPPPRRSAARRLHAGQFRGAETQDLRRKHDTMMEDGVFFKHEAFLLTIKRTFDLATPSILALFAISQVVGMKGFGAQKGKVCELRRAAYSGGTASRKTHTSTKLHIFPIDKDKTQHKTFCSDF